MRSRLSVCSTAVWVLLLPAYLSAQNQKCIWNMHTCAHTQMHSHLYLCLHLYFLESTASPIPVEGKGTSWFSPSPYFNCLIGEWEDWLPCSLVHLCVWKQALSSVDPITLPWRCSFLLLGFWHPIQGYILVSTPSTPLLGGDKLGQLHLAGTCTAFHLLCPHHDGSEQNSWEGEKRAERGRKRNKRKHTHHQV